jgi:hypothetical protein
VYFHPTGNLWSSGNYVFAPEFVGEFHVLHPGRPPDFRTISHYDGQVIAFKSGALVPDGVITLPESADHGRRISYDLGMRREEHRY